MTCKISSPDNEEAVLCVRDRRCAEWSTKSKTFVLHPVIVLGVTQVILTMLCRGYDFSRTPPPHLQLYRVEPQRKELLIIVLFSSLSALIV